MAYLAASENNVKINFRPGVEYHRRSEIHAVYGGQRQGGISTPAGIPLIFVFTGELGDLYGYRDGWNADGTFSYTGEGQIGDMTFTRGNKAILQHARNHCDILLFEKTRRSGYYRFSGVYACAGWDYRSAPDRNGKSRQAIIFNLLPLQVDGPIQIEEEKAREASTGLRPFPELRQEAYKAAAELPSRVKGGQPKVYYERDRTVRAYVLERANGICESCEQPAPFKRKSNATPYLEPHHIRRISDGGPDHPRWVAGICPTCHREIHHGLNGQVRNSQLSVRIAAIEDHLDNKLD